MKPNLPNLHFDQYFMLLLKTTKILEFYHMHSQVKILILPKNPTIFIQRVIFSGNYCLAVFNKLSLARPLLVLFASLLLKQAKT